MNLAEDIDWKRRKGQELENVRFETVDEEEGAQFAHPVLNEISRHRGERCRCCSRLEDFFAVFGKSSRSGNDRLVGSTSPSGRDGLAYAWRAHSDE